MSGCVLTLCLLRLFHAFIRYGVNILPLFIAAAGRMLP